MKVPKIKELAIGDLTAKFPLIQGGMGVGISLSGLASAVANQGGVGVRVSDTSTGEQPRAREDNCLRLLSLVLRNGCVC